MQAAFPLMNNGHSVCIKKAAFATLCAIKAQILANQIGAQDDLL